MAEFLRKENAFVGCFELFIVLLVLGIAIIVYGLIKWPDNGEEQDEIHDPDC